MSKTRGVFNTSNLQSPIQQQHDYSSYREELATKVEDMYSDLHDKFNQKVVKNSSMNSQKQFSKVMPRPSSVITYNRNMASIKDIKAMRKYAKEREYR